MTSMSVRLGIAATLCSVAVCIAAEKQEVKGAVRVTAANYALSPPLSKIADPPSKAPRRTLRPDAIREQPLGRIPRPRTRSADAPDRPDPVAQRAMPPPAMPSPLFTFEGIDNLDGVYPPDCNGDVGLNHYVEMVNLHMCIYDKVTGTNLVAPFLMSSLYAAAGFPAPASTTDDGDPIVLYDHLAHRWFISQFIISVSPPRQVIAISQTSDPTGAWHLYDFVMPNTKMNDYPHFGVWPDAYYMTDNQFSGFSWAGAGVFAFDRAKMLAGDPSATYQYFDLFGVDPDFGGMLPADLDGPPPPAGTPGYFLMVDDSFVNPFDAMYLWEFRVDWTNPANSTFGNAGLPDLTNAVADFDSTFTGGRNNIPQPGTAQKLDAIADRLMHRVQYRNFGAYETLVASHTVDVGTDHAGVRWYHMRRTLPAGQFTIHDQGTFAPDEAHRWMGSAAMDGQGNLAIGYSVSSTSIFPSIRYAGRLATDPTGGMFQGEAELWAGGGSQTGSGARWGDYTMLSVDPSDEVTFWYVNEYYPVTAPVAWHTRIGSFRLGSPTQGTITGRVTDAVSGAGIAGATVQSDVGFSTPTLASGAYALSLQTGTVLLAASAIDYEPSSTATVAVLLNTTSAQNFVLSPVPLRILPRTGLAAAGLEGGPFTPSALAFTLTNASIATLEWTSTLDVAWATHTPRGGSLAAGAATTVWLAITSDADFLGTGAYSGALVFSNSTSGTAQSRPVAISVGRFLVNLGCDGFALGQPAGWIVRTNGDPVASAAWRFDSPGGRANLTGGSGLYAAVDDDIHGAAVLTDTELVTAPVDLSGVTEAVLEFRHAFLWYESEVIDVDVSTSGDAGPWDNVWTRAASSTGFQSVDLSAYAGSPAVHVRFRYHDEGGWGYYWQLDDVCFKGSVSQDSGALGVKPAGGLDASGYAGGPFGPSRVYRLTNSSLSSLAWTAQVDVAWVSLSTNGGELAAGGALDVAVGIHGSANALAPGAYAGALVVSNVSAGLAQSRDLALEVLEPLVVAPTDPFLSSGLEGGPFTPPSRSYAISNAGAISVEFSISTTNPWISLSSVGGPLAAGASTSVTATLVDAALTVPAVYSGAVVLFDEETSVSWTLAATVSVIEIRGDIGVYDSVVPTNNLDLPFGTVAPGAATTQSVLVVNHDPPGGRDLTIDSVFLGYVFEDFSDGLAQGWREDVPADWSINAGSYVAQTPGENFLTALYTSSVVRSDAAIEARVWRNGTFGWSHGVALRASDDFDADGTGSAYLFVVDGDTYYGVFAVDGATGVELQGWSLANGMVSGATNRIAASAEGTTLRFFINGTMVWTGEDTRFTTGRVALIAYSDATDQPEYRFDDIVVQPPIQPVVGLGRKQIYLNSVPLAGGGPRGTLRATRAPAPPAPFFPPEPPSLGVTMPPFSVTNLPALPLTLPPGGQFGFDVIYAPRQIGTNRNAVTVRSDDNNEAEVSVALTGRPGQGMVTGRVTSANTGAGLSGARVTVAGPITNWTTLTAASGAYQRPALAGTYSVTATLVNYTTGTVSGVTVVDGGTADASFVLTGSELTYAPTGMTFVLGYGQAQTNTAWLTNSGPLEIDFSMAARTVVGNAPFHIPAFTGSVPSSPHAPSAAKAPAIKGIDPETPGIAAPARRLCYGINMDAQTLVSFYTDDPGTLTTIGATGANLIPAVDFLNYDFSRLYALDFDANSLLQISVADASRTVVGSSVPASGQNWTGLAGTPDGALFAASTDGSVSKLYTLNPADGAATLIGNISGAPGIIAIASDGDGQLYGLDIVGDALFAIDRTTGAGASIGAIGFDANFAQGMDFDEADGVLYLAAYNNTAGRGELRIADTTTGATTLVAPFQGGAELCMAVVSESRPAWLTLPQPTGALASAASTTRPVVADAASLANEPVTARAEIVFSGSFVNDTPRLPVELILIPDDLSVRPAADSSSVGQTGGPFAPSSFGFAVSNRGVSAISWSVTNDAAWLSVASTGGILSAAASISLTPALNGAANSLVVGVYTATLRFVNLASGLGQTRRVILTVNPDAPDYFTELFSGANDLDNGMLILTPNGGADYYIACRSNGVSAFATDPTGGTTLSLSDDDSVQVSFDGGLTVPLYGVSRSGLFVGSNGYITFGIGDTTYGESVADHFLLPRVAALYDDLDPSGGGTVSWKQLPDRVAVTWQDVPQYGQSDANSFQIELFTSGVIRVTWLGIGSTDGLAGISEGLGEPVDFVASDLTAYGACSGPLPVVSFSPQPADDCDAITVLYRSSGRPLDGYSPLYVTATFDGGSSWRDSMMTPAGGGDWYAVLQSPPGARSLVVNFRNDTNLFAGEIDDNDGLNWSMPIGPCVGLAITNPVTDVQHVAPALGAFDVKGFCNTSVFTGSLRWSNTLTGAAGAIPVSASWVAPAVALSFGSNAIVVTATNPMTETIGAADHGTNAAYAAGWTNGSNGGTGWGGGWTQQAWNGVATFFIATNDPGNLSAGPNAWALAVSNGATGEAQRDFAQPLAVGHSFRMRFDNNWIANGSSIGFGLQNAAGSNLFEFLFIGGSSTYVINDSTNGRATTIPWSGDGWDLSWTRTAAGHYALTCGAHTVEGSVLNVADLAPARLKIWNYSAGPAWQHTLYFNDLRIVTGSTPAGSTNDSVVIVRLVAGVDGDGDGMADDWELGRDLVIGVNDATNNPDGDFWSNVQEYIADTNPNVSNEPLRVVITTATGGVSFVAGPSTTNSRQYDVQLSSNLLQSGWMPWQTNLPGSPTGGVISVLLTNAPPGSAARVEIHLP